MNAVARLTEKAKLENRETLVYKGHKSWAGRVDLLAFAVGAIVVIAAVLIGRHIGMDISPLKGARWGLGIGFGVGLVLSFAAAYTIIVLSNRLSR